MAVPAQVDRRDILALHPDGVVLSPGPGDPALLGYVVEHGEGADRPRADPGHLPGPPGHGHRRRRAGRTSCKFGHRGANHPVKDIATGRVHITSQNHGYAVDGDGLPAGVEVSHVHLNDGTVEGLRDRDEPCMTIQYHSEASPGPLDNMYMFERFVEMMSCEAMT